MPKRDKMILWIFVATLVLSVSATYYRYFVLADITFFTDESAVPDPLDPIKSLLNR